MQVLKEINLDNLNKSEIANLKVRQAARAVVFDEDGKIGLVHVANARYYKLPGGGVEEGEDIYEALRRECKEELGVDIEIEKQSVGSIIEYRRNHNLNQTSHCYIANAVSTKQSPEFTDFEKSLGFEVLWVNPLHALELLEFKGTSDYQAGFVAERDPVFLKKVLEVKKYIS